MTEGPATVSVISNLKVALRGALSAQAYAALILIPGMGWFFALPVIRDVTQFIIGRCVGWAIENTAIGLSLLWIQIEMQSEIDSAFKARAKLNDMLNNPIKYTESQQAQISEEFDASTLNLIQLGINRL